MQGVKISPHDA